MARMTDERLAEIEAWFLEWAIQGPVEDTIDELLQALKAEREYAANADFVREAYAKRIAELKNMVETIRNNLHPRIAELEAQKKDIQCVRDDLRERLDAVRKIVEVRSDGVAREVWEALEQK